MNNTINLSSYFPKEFDIISSIETNESNQIRLCVSAQEIHCPSCNSICKWNYKTHIRRIIDLPILGKPTNLIIVVKQYECKNDNCPERVLFSTIEGFTEPYRRMTKRCEDIVCAIALNMNCESASRICKIMGIQVSGDTIIRILLRRFSELPENNCSEIIGVDDWALRKGQSYGTIICDGKTHKPITLLNGRDGEELAKWLKRNKQVKIVTRDRASAYAKAISDTMPSIIQIADRFHLSNNLLTAVKSCLNEQVPSRVSIKEDAFTQNNDNKDNSKKKL